MPLDSPSLDWNDVLQMDESSDILAWSLQKNIRKSSLENYC